MRVFASRVFDSHRHWLWHDGVGGTGGWGATARAEVAALCAEGEAGGALVHERRAVTGRYV